MSVPSLRNEKGLTVKAELDTEVYPTGIHVDDETLACLAFAPESFHGE